MFETLIYRGLNYLMCGINTCLNLMPSPQLALQELQESTMKLKKI